MRVATPQGSSRAVALIVAALGTAAPACARPPAAAPVPVAGLQADAGSVERRPVGSPLSSELAAVLPLLEAAESRGCAPPPAGLSPRLRIDAACRVQVAVVVKGDGAALERRIAAGGGLVTRRGGEPLTLQAWVPPALLRAMAEDPDVAAVRVPTYARPVGPAEPAVP
jgi:hypothetical protein